MLSVVEDCPAWLLCGHLKGDQKAFSSNTEKYGPSLSSTTNTKLQISITGTLLLCYEAKQL